MQLIGFFCVVAGPARLCCSLQLQTPAWYGLLPGPVPGTCSTSCHDAHPPLLLAAAMVPGSAGLVQRAAPTVRRRRRRRSLQRQRLLQQRRRQRRQQQPDERQRPHTLATAPLQRRRWRQRPAGRLGCAALRRRGRRRAGAARAAAARPPPPGGAQHNCGVQGGGRGEWGRGQAASGMQLGHLLEVAAQPPTPTTNPHPTRARHLHTGPPSHGHSPNHPLNCPTPCPVPPPVLSCPTP